jgi:transaldolase
MGTNPLLQLRDIGQCVWLDNLSRDLIVSGRLKQMVDEEGIVGVTSNPTIFQKAISGSSLYDRSLKNMLKNGILDARELFLGLAIEDIRDAADVLQKVYGDSGCPSGYVSIEVSPDLAYDTRTTIQEARRLFSSVGKRNVFVKVPATSKGLPAIELLTREGINVNITLLFSVERSREVAEAYIRGIRQRIEKGEPVNGIVSVASFFVSRVDTLVDKLLEKRLETAASPGEREKITRLFGRAAVANSRIAYREYKKIFTDRRFLSLTEKGANPQRLLWASTSTKNPAYDEMKYVEELIAPDTVNTMPEITMKAFSERGKVRISIEDGIEGADALFTELKSLGIDIELVADQLEKEGVRSFSDSYFAVLDEIAKRRDMILSRELS